MKEDEKETGHVVPHTHWDREWRYPIWKNRMLLVEFMEELLSILDADPDYACFLLDGQSAPIEDYLEVAPQDRDRVCKYIRDGRIAVGPWYTLPDLYPVDGECLVRNLLVGMRMAESYGGTMRIGYNSFGWGQTAQFPQIYAQFGFGFIVCAKKVSRERAPDCEFLWEAPDGTRVLTTRLGTHGRGNFYYEAYLLAKYGLDCLSPDFKYKPNLSGTAMRNANPAVADEDFFMIDAPRDYDPAHLAEAAKAARGTTEETLLKTHRLYMNGTDFSTPHPEQSRMLRDLNLVSGDTHFVSSSLKSYAEALAANIDRNALRVVKGELRDGPASDCSGNALSSRIYLKLLNRRAQNLLIKKAEPFAAVLSRLGTPYPKGFFDAAWKLLLAAHPHDSINGVTQDKTADDVENRLAQVVEMAQVLLDKAAAGLLLRLDLSSFAEDDTLLVVFNPNPFPVGGVVEACVAIPAGQSAWDFTASDESGSPIRVQHRAREEKTYPVHDMAARPWPFATDRHIAFLELPEVPGVGYATLRISPKTKFARDHYYWLPMRTSDGEYLSPGDGILENEHLCARFNGDGSLNLLDKSSGESFAGLHYFEDTGDVGNYWAFYPPYRDRTCTTRGGTTRQWLEENGPLSATFAVEYLFEIPATACESAFGVRGASERSAETVQLRIVSRFTLRKGERRLDIRTAMRNVARHHRLRVGFPTRIAAETADASGHFTVDQRPAVPVRDAVGEYWPEMQTLPMQHFVDVHSGGRGLALLNKGLTEYEMRDDPDKTLYLTLFRAMGNMIVTWWEAVGVFPGKDGSQLLRELDFEYSIYPHRGDWSEGKVYREADAYCSGLFAYQVTARTSGSLGAKAGFLSVEPPELVLSALKKAEVGEGLILRLFNPGASEVLGRISVAFPATRAWEVDLSERRIRETEIGSDGVIRTLVPAGRIFSVEVE